MWFYSNRTKKALFFCVAETSESISIPAKKVREKEKQETKYYI